MKTIELNAYARQESGKNANHRTRAKGHIPFVLYGQDITPANLSFDAREFHASVGKAGGEMFMCKIKADSAGITDQLAVIRDIQRDPVTERIIHLDLMRVDVNKKIDIEVAVHGIGTPVGLRDGGVLEQVLRTIHMRCLPTQVPSHLEVEISQLGIGQAIHVSDLKFEAGIEVRNHATDVIFHVAIPRKEAEGTGEPGANEPEVITAKKKEEAGKDEKKK